MKNVGACGLAGRLCTSQVGRAEVPYGGRMVRSVGAGHTTPICARGDLTGNEAPPPRVTSTYDGGFRPCFARLHSPPKEESTFM